MPFTITTAQACHAFTQEPVATKTPKSKVSSKSKAPQNRILLGSGAAKRIFALKYMDWVAKGATGFCNFTASGTVLQDRFYPTACPKNKHSVEMRSQGRTFALNP